MTGHITLRQLAGMLRDVVSAMAEPLWVTAEIARVTRHPSSGHCYLELVEKDGDSVVAQMRATIWARTYLPLQRQFRADTGKDFAPGMKILFQGTLTYHEVYGLAVNINAVDSTYTLGEMAARKRETLERLAREGIIDTNRSLPFPPVAQRIALISSRNAAGYEDFMHVLESNRHGYRFRVEFFQTLLQGEGSVQSLAAALALCADRAAEFDAAVIVRGGGATTDLTAFDAYEVAREICLFPIPVLTGIGHERDETVADRAAHRRLITPTSAAEFIVARALEFETGMEALAREAAVRARSSLDAARFALIHAARSVASSANAILAAARHGVSARTAALAPAAASAIRARRILLGAAGPALAARPPRLVASADARLDALSARLALLDPANVLKRGYTITLFKGKAVRSPRGLVPGDAIFTRLASGSIASEVRSTDEGTSDERT